MAGNFQRTMIKMIIRSPLSLIKTGLNSQVVSLSRWNIGWTQKTDRVYVILIMRWSWFAFVFKRGFVVLKMRGKWGGASPYSGKSKNTYESLYADWWSLGVCQGFWRIPCCTDPLNTRCVEPRGTPEFLKWKWNRNVYQYKFYLKLIKMNFHCLWFVRNEP